MRLTVHRTAFWSGLMAASLVPVAAMADSTFECQFGPLGRNVRLKATIVERPDYLTLTYSASYSGSAENFDIVETNAGGLLAIQNVKMYSKADPALVRRAKTKSEIMASLTVIGAGMSVISLDRTTGHSR